MDDFEKNDAIMKRYNDAFAYEHLAESFHSMGKRYRALAGTILLTHIPGKRRDKTIELLLQSFDAALESQKVTDESD